MKWNLRLIVRLIEYFVPDPASLVPSLERSPLSPALYFEMS